jgi:uncharacterized membrane protein
VAERHRFLMALGVAGALGILVGLYVGAARASWNADAALAIGGLLFLDAWCLVYVCATASAFAGQPTEVLRTLDRPHARGWWPRILRSGSDGPLLAILFAAVALVAAAVLPRVDKLVPAGAEQVLLLVLAVSAIVLGWAVLAVGFAVHYIRLDDVHSGLQFPGPADPQFVDYLYFAVSVATTFGTTDVNVTNQLLRRTVTVHAVLGFVFNTVILALVIAALSP